MPNLTGMFSRLSPLRSAQVPPAGLIGPAQGIAAEAQMLERTQQGTLQGLTAMAQFAERQEDKRAREKREALATQMGYLHIAAQMIDNKNTPPEMKRQLWNSGVRPAFNTLATAEGPVKADALLPELAEWPDALGGFMKRARGIMDDKALTLDQKLGALRMLQVEASSDAALAPMIAELKEQNARQHSADVFRATELLSDVWGGSGSVSPETAEGYASLRKRNPIAIAEAARWITENGLMRPIGAPPRVAMEPTAAAPATSAATPGQRIGALDAEIQALMGQPAQLRRVGDPKPEQINQRIANLRAERDRLIQERNRAEELPRKVEEQRMLLPGKVTEQAALEPGRIRIAQQTGAAAANIKRDQPLGEAATGYINRYTLEPPTPDTPLADVTKKGGAYIAISPSQAQRLPQFHSTMTGLDLAEQIVASRPDLFPPSTGSTARDAAAVAQAKLTYQALKLSGADPDVAQLETLKGQLPQTVRLFGDTGNVAVAERIMAQEFFGVSPATRETVSAKLGTLRKLVNESFSLAKDFKRPKAAAPGGDLSGLSDAEIMRRLRGGP